MTMLLAALFLPAAISEELDEQWRQWMANAPAKAMTASGVLSARADALVAGLAANLTLTGDIDVVCSGAVRLHKHLKPSHSQKK
jgi:hypothetical protein